MGECLTGDFETAFIALPPTPTPCKEAVTGYESKHPPRIFKQTRKIISTKARVISKNKTNIADETVFLVFFFVCMKRRSYISS
jgi:hypothetical protein